MFLQRTVVNRSQSRRRPQPPQHRPATTARTQVMCACSSSRAEARWHAARRTRSGAATAERSESEEGGRCARAIPARRCQRRRRQDRGQGGNCNRDCGQRQQRRQDRVGQDAEGETNGAIVRRSKVLIGIRCGVERAGDTCARRRPIVRQRVRQRADLRQHEQQAARERERPCRARAGSEGRSSSQAKPIKRIESRRRGAIRTSKRACWHKVTRFRTRLARLLTLPLRLMTCNATAL